MDRTLDLMLAIQAAATVAEVSARVSAAARPLGFPVHAIGPVPGADEPIADDFFLVHNWPETWGETYEAEGFGAFDPVPRAAGLVSVPVTLTEVMAGRAGFLPDPRAARLLEAAAAVGCPNGVLVPIFGPGGYRALACFAGPGPDPGPRDMAFLHVLGIYAHDRLRALTVAHRAAPEQKLSARELSVLRCARDGLSDAETARLLKISVRTVRFHYDNLRRKLGAATRAQAMATAAAMGLIGD